MATDPGTPEMTPAEISALERAELEEAVAARGQEAAGVPVPDDGQPRCLHPDHGPEGKVIPWAGRGRRPRWCAEHKDAGRQGARRTAAPDDDTAPVRPRVAPGAGRPDKLTQALAMQLYQVGFVLWAIPRTRADGAIIMGNSQAVAQAWGDLAKTDANVRKALTAMTTGSAWGQALMATASVGIQIAANHEMVPVEVGQGFAAMNRAVVTTPTLPADNV